MFKTTFIASLGACLLACTCAITIGFGQDERCLSWAETVAGQVKNASVDEAKWVKKTLAPVICNELLSPKQRVDIEETTALLAAKRITASKGLLDYLHAVEQIAQSDTSRWSDWHEVLNFMLNEKKGRKYIQPFLKLSTPLLLDDVVGTGPRHQWRLTGKPWYFEVMEETALLRFDSCALTLSHQGDSLRFEDVAGQWDLSDTECALSASRFPWIGTTLDSSITFAMLPATTVDFSRDEFRLDSVLFHSSFSNRPLLGKLTAKLEPGVAREKKAYPMVRCSNSLIELDSLYGAFRFRGGMDIRGSSLRGIGTLDAPAVLELVQADTVFMAFQTSEIVFNDVGLTAPNAAFGLFFQGDTLSHPDCMLRFDQRAETISVTRQSDGLGQQSFMDAYHELEWDVEGLSWKLGDPAIEIGYPLVKSAKSGVFLSLDYFEKASFDQIQGIDPIHPVVELYRFWKTTGLRVFNSIDYAQYIKLSEVQARVAMMNLANDGYLQYNQDERLATINTKTFDHIGYVSGRRDHDVIRLDSKPRKGNNAEWSLLNGALQVNGVNRLVFSQARGVFIEPDGEEVQVAAGRDMTLSGLVHAGNVKLNGENMAFDYDAFTIDFNKIDEVQLSVNDLENLNYRGEPKKIWLKNSLQDISGSLAIDAPFNRSGNESDLHPTYPEFTSKGTSYVYYDNPGLFDGAYKRDNFYYAVEPFELTGLDNLTADNFQLEGVLVSAGIVPEIHQPLVVMEDYFMGLTSITPLDGSTLYSGNAMFTSALSLDGSGFRGAGDIDFLNAHVVGESLIFLPDSIIGPFVAFENGADEGQDIPLAEGIKGTVNFNPADEHLTVRSGREPLSMYGGEAMLSGELTVQGAGLSGAGWLDLAKAGITADDFAFKHHHTMTDSAAFELYANHSSLAAFETENVRGEIDFEQRRGEFVPNSGETAIELPIQQYLCYMDRFRWFMDDDEIDLISERDTDALPLNFSENRNLSNFVSTHPEQDSLHFLSTHATYLVGDDILKCNGVKEIAVADSRLFPDSGLVIIQRDADIERMSNARIIANATTQFHLIEPATVKVHGRYDYTGSGEYQYKGADKTIQSLILDDISVDASTQTIASGSVYARDEFLLDPFFQFAGEFSMEASEEFLRFTGGAQMTQSCKQFQTTWIQFDALIDPKQVAIPIPPSPEDVDGDPLACGMLASTRAPFTLSPAFLNPLADETEVPLLLPEGALRFKDGQYIIAQEVDLNETKAVGNRIILDTQTCQLTGSGTVELPLNYGLVDNSMVGSFFIDSRGEYHFKGTILLGYHFHPDLYERMVAQIPSWQSSEPLDIGATNYEQALQTWIGIEESAKLINDLAMTGSLKNIPKMLQKGVVLTDVDLVWDDPEEAWVSTSEFGVVSLGKEALFTRIPGKLILNRSRSGDAFTLYFHGDEENWYYHDFKLTNGKDGKMNLTTSDMAFYEMLAELKASKREETAKDGQSFFFQYMASRRRRDNLVDAYRDFD